MKPEPQWHDFPFKSGLYALRCGEYVAIAHIYGEGSVWYYRNEGYRTYLHLPPEELFCILHPKQLDRQIAQNNLYDKIEQTGRSKYKV